MGVLGWMVGRCVWIAGWGFERLVGELGEERNV
jgi:hypothetical protein